jgi:uncharacterized protein YgbK (DUF1537 family)
MRLAILADDLTGALDAAAPFHNSGFTAEVWLHLGGSRDASLLPDVVALTTETRHATPQGAAAAVRRAVEVLRPYELQRFYKKMDSTLRGPWAAEVAALREALDLPLAVVCPALPAQGRRVAGGKVWVRDTPVGSCVAPLHAARSGPVLEVSATNDSLRILTALDLLQASDARYLVADAEEEAHLDAIIEGTEQVGARCLLCGSAGLATAWARVLGGTEAGQAPPLPHVSRWLVVAGSRHPLTCAQVARLQEHLSARPQAGRQVEVLTPSPGAAGNDDDPALARALAEEAAGRHAHHPFEAFCLTGGETAAWVLRALEASRLRLAGEPEPGVALAQINDGAAHGCYCLTKAGAFGDPETLARLLQG